MKAWLVPNGFYPSQQLQCVKLRYSGRKLVNKDNQQLVIGQLKVT
ncbi:hypothetical protein [Dendronalium sp. ChiSLP03b]